MTHPLLDKIRSLLELAAHEATPVEEARTSAVAACRMIVKHKVELRVPGDVPGSRRVWVPGDLSSMFTDFEAWLRSTGTEDFQEWLKQARSKPKEELRQVHTANAAEYLRLRCACCGVQVRPGTRFAWVGDLPFIDEEAGTIARVVHESCMEHWSRPKCSACNKRTDRSRAVREKLRDHVREPPGTTRAQASGYCYCCGGMFDVDEKVVQRGFMFVHLKCCGHFSQSPCRKCGGGAKF